MNGPKKIDPYEPMFWTLGDVFIGGLDGETGKFTFIGRRDDCIEVECEVINDETVS